MPKTSSPALAAAPPLPASAAPSIGSATATPHHGQRALRAFLRNPTAIAGLLLLALIMAGAALAPLVYPDDPLGMVGRPLLWPGKQWTHPLGTDSLGRDVAAGLMHGARISLLVGFAATCVGLSLGILVGAVAGYRGGWVDDALVRLIEIFQAVPSFILLVVLVAIAQPSVATIVGSIGIVTWPTIARLVRAEVRALRSKDFVVAARGMGYGHGRIILREILPNAMPPVIVTSSVMVASAILMEAALSFMGLGDPNTVSWGSMIGAGRELLRTAWYLTALPGLLIVVTVLSLNLIGDGLNDALNPRLEEDR
ncbi:ABC transporter permease [Azospirillum doebereinerae]